MNYNANFSSLNHKGLGQTFVRWAWNIWWYLVDIYRDTIMFDCCYIKRYMIMFECWYIQRDLIMFEFCFKSENSNLFLTSSPLPAWNTFIIKFYSESRTCLAGYIVCWQYFFLSAFRLSYEHINFEIHINVLFQRSDEYAPSARVYASALDRSERQPSSKSANLSLPSMVS